MGWHTRAAELTNGDDEAGARAALILLEHAASGLLHAPARETLAGLTARADVHLAVYELDTAGITVPPAFEAGPEQVTTSDVRPLLERAAFLLAATVDTVAYPVPVAFAAIHTRQALSALSALGHE
ncbi:hypothetical protein I6A84_05810 [Frankia sp. CNm7]|uniref:Uncharacterized protein n=1 Tax=Frankia nepalensis TaxID=1836974 RepID=A0A937UWN1_9ACTN|nr:hypothetical protein [Frankia nepalensis]MBL7501948.1 hypothetical protein [Frankia nepalensis]MBL7513925.1 hypothetical protein [Frankia nepalensis]MBL7517652.1 hypothetical protein [Frankia nepalensis]MBL7633571.1 hypothetical protein [Frankia nepalensis]